MDPENKKRAPDYPSLDDAPCGEEKINKVRDKHVMEEVDDKLIGDDLTIERAKKSEAGSENDSGDRENNY